MIRFFARREDYFQLVTDHSLVIRVRKEPQLRRFLVDRGIQWVDTGTRVIVEPMGATSCRPISQHPAATVYRFGADPGAWLVAHSIHMYTDATLGGG